MSLIEDFKQPSLVFARVPSLFVCVKQGIQGLLKSLILKRSMRTKNNGLLKKYQEDFISIDKSLLKKYQEDKAHSLHTSF